MFSKNAEPFSGKFIMPFRIISFSHTLNSSMPSLTFDCRAWCRLVCATSSTGLSFFSACFSCFSVLLLNQSVTQAGDVLSEKLFLCLAYSNNNPNPCLHGNLRLGQEHLKAILTISI